jgi:hypothetical protein
MNKLLVILFISAISVSCDESDSGGLCPGAVSATVRNLTGLDGCGFVFVLKDGTKLEPLLLAYCGTPPLSEEITEDPLFDFEWVDGKKVFITYEVTKAGSYCMVGPVVKITCLSETGASQETED